MPTFNFSTNSDQRWARQFRKSPGEHGTWIVEETGLCVASEAADIEAGCTKRFVLEALPQARGVIMKVLDGTAPVLIKVKPPTYNETYNCVKVFGEVQPFAPEQEFGTWNGKAILSYTIRYQEVGDIV